MVDKLLGQQEDIRDRQPGFELDMVLSAVDRQQLDSVEQEGNPVVIIQYYGLEQKN